VKYVEITRKPSQIIFAEAAWTFKKSWGAFQEDTSFAGNRSKIFILKSRKCKTN
jgi:hypothetical protein